MTEPRLREFEELVLLSVLIASPEAHGPSLQKVLAAEAGRDVSLGAIYTALERLTKKGLVSSELGEPTDTPVVVYCRSGARSRRAASILTQAGFTVVDAGTQGAFPVELRA